MKAKLRDHDFKNFGYSVKNFCQPVIQPKRCTETWIRSVTLCMRNISTESMSLVNSTVYILGAGAIGKALAVFLSNAHRNVMLVRTSIDHYAMREESCTVELHDGSSLQASVPTCALAELSALEGIIVLANKAHANEAIAKKLMNKTGNSPLIVMQNGLDVEKSFLENFDTVLSMCVVCYQ
jgi:2-dehydropantoate 2-reductase